MLARMLAGAGPPGGSWQSMSPSTVTLSPGSWMDLPGGDPWMDGFAVFRTRQKCLEGAVWIKRTVRQMQWHPFCRSLLSRSPAWGACFGRGWGRTNPGFLHGLVQREAWSDSLQTMI